MSLCGLGIETLLPRIRRRMTNDARTAASTRIKSLFPGYLFARFDPSAMAAKVRYARGVVHIVAAGRTPLSLDDAVIALIMHRLGPDGFVRTTSHLEAGDLVRITAGPLEGIVCVFDASMMAVDRVRILLSTISGRMRIVVDPELLSPAQAS